MKHNLLDALASVLRPMVRIALKSDVGFPEFSATLRRAYLEVAREIACEQGHEPSERRLRFMTGLSLRDVQTMTDDSMDSTEGRAEDVHVVGSKVLSAWHSDLPWSLWMGVASELPIDAPNGTASFTGLVQQVDPTADPKLVLEWLLHAGCVREVAPGRYQAITRVYLAQTLDEDGVRYFALTASRFMATLERNLTSETADRKLLERRVFADHGVPAHRLPELLAMAKERWADFADPIDVWMNNSTQNTSRKRLHSDEVVQTGVGIYQYVYTEQADTPKDAPESMRNLK